jgi:DNA-binding transcriptional LysR family regulator
VLRNPDLRPVGWVGVELRHFLALDAVATEGSFNRAAERLGYTQSAVSQQIAALERVVGERLVDRPGGSQPVRLTRAGEIVIQHARAIGARLATAQADLQSLAAGGLDPLRVGFPGHGMGALMPAVLRGLDEVYPDLVVRIIESPDEEELVGMLRRGEVDLGFAYLPLRAAEDCEHVVLLEDDYVLVVGPEWSETKPSAQLTIEELAEVHLIGLKRPKTCQITDYFHSHNLRPKWVIASNDIETIYGSVSAGIGVALLPRLATLSLGSAVTVLELDCGFPPRRMGIAWSKARQQSESADVFVRAAKAEAARLTRATRLKVAS